jgi:hypothetical protein
VRRHGGTLLLTLLVLVLVLVLAACAPGPNPEVGTAAVAAGDPAGFWLGLWHGLIAPITFVVSLFNDAVNVYEVHNSGNLYNFGYVLGLGFIVGGSNAGSRR